MACHSQSLVCNGGLNWEPVNKQPLDMGMNGLIILCDLATKP